MNFIGGPLKLKGQKVSVKSKGIKKAKDEKPKIETESEKKFR
jgi:hypothetical protein